MLILNLYELHHDEEQWGPEHNKFIPDRFDLDSAFSANEKLRRKCKSRHLFCFIPFLGSKRVFVGKAFADIAFRTVLPLMLKAFNDKGVIGEFID